MRLANYLIRPNWGHLAFVTVLFAACVAYLFDVVSTSTDTQNLLLPLPAAVLAGVLYLTIVLREFRRTEGAMREPGQVGGTTWAQFRTPVLMALVGAYLLAITWSGFDVSTFLFVAACLGVQGERRMILLLGYAAAFTIVVVLGMRALLPFPLPTLIL